MQHANRTLRMADGGNVLTRWAASVMRPTQARLRQDDVPAPPSQPPQPPPPPLQTASPVTSDNPAGIRFANGGALRGGGDTYVKGSTDGGRVVGPGTGISDSVPARYSNGEYVFPADTAAAIGHDNLDAIKDATHTPAAVQRGLRDGSNEQQEAQHSRATAPTREGLRDGPLDSEAVRVRLPGVWGGDPGQRRNPSLRLADGGIPGMDALERPWNGAQDARAFTPQPGPGPGNPNVGSAGSAEARAFRQPVTPAALPEPVPSQSFAQRATSAIKAPGIAIANAGTATGNAVNAVNSAIGDAGTAVGKFAKGAVGPALRSGSNFLGVLPHAAAYTDGNVPFADKLRIGGTDLARGAGTAAGSVFGGAVGTALLPVAGSVTGGVLGGIAGDHLGHKAGDYLFSGDDALRRNGYDPERNIVDSAKDAFAGKSANAIFGGHAGASRAGAGRGSVNPVFTPEGADPSALHSESAAGAGRGSVNPEALRAGADADMPGQDPGRGPLLGGQSGTQLPGARGVSKFTQNGKTLYSNVTGDDNDKLMSGKPGASVVPGMDQATIDRTLGGNSVGQQNSDNAIMAANLRDGVDINRGTAQDVAAQGQRQLQALAHSPMGTAGRGFAQKQLMAAQEQGIQRRGQDITERDNIRTNNTSLTNSRATNALGIHNALREQGNWRDNHALAVSTANLTARDSAATALQKNLEAQYRTKDDKGNDVPDHAKIGQYRTAIAATVPEMVKELEKAGTPAALDRAKELRERGPAALGEDDHADMKQLFDQRDRLAASRGLLPGGGKFMQSDNLLGYRREGGITPRSIGGDRVATKNGSSVSLNDLRYANGPANAVLPDFNKVETDDLTRNLKLR